MVIQWSFRSERWIYTPQVRWVCQWWVSSHKYKIGQEEMALSYARGGLDWIMGGLSRPYAGIIEGNQQIRTHEPEAVSPQEQGSESVPLQH